MLLKTSTALLVATLAAGAFPGDLALARSKKAGPAAARHTKKVPLPATPVTPPLSERSFKDIIANYSFAADFEPKEPERELPGEVFWRYPYVLPKIEFPLHEAISEPQVEMPATKGHGRPVDHLNRGRVLFLDGKYDEATAVWLGARARYGKEYLFHRRDDYFIGYGFLNWGAQKRAAAGGDWQDLEVKTTYSNAATFLSWALIMKEDVTDALVEAVAPKGYYNLAALYWRYDRFAGAYGAAAKGIEFLRRTGRKEYRPQFLRFLAEAHIKNRTYLDAVRNLDLAIRQDPEPAVAAAAFARVGDIYFDLNNYELAEDAYALGARIDEERLAINPAELVLRGESLFWLGRFDDAQKVLHFALNAGGFRQLTGPMPEGFAGWASLRLADAYLARANRVRAGLSAAALAALQGDKPEARCSDEIAGKTKVAAELAPYCEELRKARLEYYKVGHAFRSTFPGRVAKIREACLELPGYHGNNVRHARELLEEAKAGPDLPAIAREIAWSCQVGSYTDRERSPEMLDRVRGFAEAHPESVFLSQFVEPVRSFQASHLEPLLERGDYYNAVSFFTKNRVNLFPTIPRALGAQMFVAFADVGDPVRAAEFWQPYKDEPDTDMKALRLAGVAAEMSARGKGGEWERRNAHHAREWPKRIWKIEATAGATEYFNRVRLAKDGTKHRPWLKNLARHWSAQDSAAMCDYEYPLLSMMDETPKDRPYVAARVSALIEELLPALFGQDESCALSLLELEANRLKQAPKELAKRYLERQNWPLVAGFLHLYWVVAEHVYDVGDGASAKKMWDVIRTKGEAKAPEVRFAKARLDPEQTEFEKLWN